jgi:prepilin-type processing-associated H-X9-DG protein
LPAQPLLADAPSAPLPGQAFPSHGGQGRNVLFEDGHIRFLPVASDDTADEFLSRSEDSAARGISAPIIFVSGH